MNKTKLNCKLLFYVIKFYNFLFCVFKKKFWCYFKQQNFYNKYVANANILALSVNKWQNIIQFCSHLLPLDLLY